MHTDANPTMQRYAARQRQAAALANALLTGGSGKNCARAWPIVQNQPPVPAMRAIAVCLIAHEASAAANAA